jgi:hypothetical protein
VLSEHCDQVRRKPLRVTTHPFLTLDHISARMSRAYSQLTFDQI